MENSNLKWTDWLKAVFIVIFAVILFRVVQSAGWISGLNAQGKELTLGVSFLIGVAASFSSCLAVVGGIVIVFSEKYRSDAQDNFFQGAFLPNIKFHIGRAATFFVLGGLLGAIGGGINISGNFVSIYTIIIAIVMGWLGLSILGIAPSISSVGLKPPKLLLRWWGKLEDSEHRAAPYFLGGLTFFLPCGFTQSMQILALASGSFWSGGLAMLMFSLGTMPVLLFLGATASWAKLEKIAFINKASGIIVILFAVYTFNSGFSLWGAKNNIAGNSPDQKQETSDGANNSFSGGAAQKVEMKITSRGFEPSVLSVKNNIPVRFAVNGDGATGCTNKIVIPDLNIAKDIKKGENVIEFTPKKAGPIAFSCWMGMVRGKIIVEP